MTKTLKSFLINQNDGGCGCSATCRCGPSCNCEAERRCGEACTCAA